MAQNLNVSPLSYYGIGLSEQSETFNQRLMGATSTASRPFLGSNLSNPANASKLSTTVFDLGMYSSVQRIEEGNVSASNQNTRFSYLYFAFPIKANSIGFSASLKPYTSMGYFNKSENQDALQTTTNTFWGKGGLNALDFALSKQFVIDSSFFVALGAQYRFLFGSTDQTQKTEFSLGGTLPFSSHTTTSMNASSFSLGLDLEKTINNTTVFAGVVLHNKSTLEISKNMLTTTFKNQNTIDVVDTINHLKDEQLTTQLPTNISIGLGANFNKRVGFSVQYDLSDWSSFSMNNQTFTSLSSLSLGTQIALSAKEKENVPTLFLGVRSSEGFLNLNGTDLIRRAFSGGLALPVGLRNKSNTALIFGIELADYITGETTYSETHFNFLFGLSITPGVYDKWFRKPKID